MPNSTLSAQSKKNPRSAQANDALGDTAPSSPPHLQLLAADLGDDEQAAAIINEEGRLTADIDPDYMAVLLGIK